MRTIVSGGTHAHRGIETMSLLPPQIIFPHVGGIDRTTNRDVLPEHVTDDLENMYPDLDGVLKRPGMVRTIDVQITTHDLGIYDMVRFGMKAINGGNVVADSIYCLFNDVGIQRLSLGQLIIGSPSTFIQVIADVDGALDVRGDRELIPVGPDMMHLTADAIAVGRFGRKIEFDQVGGTFIATDNFPQGRYSTGAYHRDHLILCGSHESGANPTDNEIPEFGWSDTADARTFPALNTEQVRPIGYEGALNGIRIIGDIVYFLKVESIWAMTGGVQELWRLERLTSRIGGYGTKSCVDVDGVLMGMSFDRGWGNSSGLGSTSSLETQYPNNIYAVSGFRVELIGARIRPILQAAFPQDDDGGAFDESGLKVQRAVYWPTRELAIFIPRIPRSFALPTEAVVYAKGSATWWHWTFPSTTIGINAMVEVNRRIHLGCRDGRIRHFEDTAPNDDGTNFTAQITSRRLFGPDRQRKYGLENIIVKGSQTSGGTSTVAVAREENAFTTVFSPTLGATDRGEFAVVRGLNAARYWRIRVTCPTAGVESKIRWIQYQLKDMGPT